MTRYLKEDENGDDLPHREQQAGIGGLGDRSSSDEGKAGRTGAGSGFDADELRRPAGTDPDDPPDEEEGAFSEEETNAFSTDKQ